MHCEALRLLSSREPTGWGHDAGLTDRARYSDGRVFRAKRSQGRAHLPHRDFAGAPQVTRGGVAAAPEGRLPEWPTRDSLRAVSGGDCLEIAECRTAHVVGAQGAFDRMVALQCARIVDVSLEEALAVPKRVDINGDPVITARGISISFGDE